MKNVIIALWWSLRPLSLTNILLKDGGFLVKTKSISDVWVLVNHVSDFTTFVKWKRSQKSLRLFEPTFSRFMFIFKSP